MNKSLILNIITLILVSALIVLAVVFLPFSNSQSPAATSTTTQAQADDTITVYGQGKVSIEPDVAYVTLGVETTNIDPQKAMDDNTKQINTITEALKSVGIEDNNIQTTDFSVYPQYDYQNGMDEFVGYEVTNTVRVTINDVEKTGEIIKAASAAGANRFQSIQFDVIERQNAYNDALSAALARAEEKAQQLASETDRSIAGVVSVQESGTSDSIYTRSLTNYAMEAESMADTTTASAVSSGELEISAVVNVIYRLK